MPSFDVEQGKPLFDVYKETFDAIWAKSAAADPEVKIIFPDTGPRLAGETAPGVPELSPPPPSPAASEDGRRVPHGAPADLDADAPGNPKRRR